MIKLSFNVTIRKMFLVALLPTSIVFSDVKILNIPSDEGHRFTLIMQDYAPGFIKKFSSELLMPGCAMFCPDETGSSDKLYLSKKQAPSDTLIDNNPSKEEYANLFRYSADMHTERQLIISALLVASGVITPPHPPKPNENLTMPTKIDDVDLNRIKKQKGSLWIYTFAPPCRMAKPKDNKNYPCTSYYKALTKCCQDVSIYVYFCANQARLDGEVFENNSELRKALSDIVKSLCRENNRKWESFELTETDELNVIQRNGSKSLISVDSPEFDYGVHFKPCVSKINNVLMKKNTTFDVRSKLILTMYEKDVAKILIPIEFDLIEATRTAR